MTARRKPTHSERVGLRRAPRDEAELAGAHDGLNAGFDAKMAADLDKVLLDGPAGQAQDTADVRGALTFLHPGEALKLAICNMASSRSGLFQS